MPWMPWMPWNALECPGLAAERNHSAGYNENSGPRTSRLSRKSYGNCNFSARASLNMSHKGHTEYHKLRSSMHCFSCLGILPPALNRNRFGCGVTNKKLVTVYGIPTCTNAVTTASEYNTYRVPHTHEPACSHYRHAPHPHSGIRRQCSVFSVQCSVPNATDAEPVRAAVYVHMHTLPSPFSAAALHPHYIYCSPPHFISLNSRPTRS
jgi:hypothetical protein